MKNLLTSLLISVLAISVHATEYTPENKTIKVVIPQSSTSGLGVVYLHLEDYARRQNITMVPVFKPGANGKIGIDYAGKEKNDGNTLLFSTISDYIENQSDNKFDEVSMVTTTELVLVSSKKSKIKTIADIAKQEKENPGKLTWSYVTSAQLALINSVAEANDLGLDKLYKIKFSGPAASQSLTGVVTGDIDLTFMLTSSLESMADKLTIVDIDEKTKQKMESRKNATALFLPKNSNPAANKFWNNFVKGFLNDIKSKTTTVKGVDEPGPNQLKQTLVNWRI